MFAKIWNLVNGKNTNITTKSRAQTTCPIECENTNTKTVKIYKHISQLMSIYIIIYIGLNIACTHVKTRYF